MELKDYLSISTKENIIDKFHYYVVKLFKKILHKLLKTNFSRYGGLSWKKRKRALEKVL